MHQLLQEQWLPLPLSDVFPFFANPENLPLLTPPWLGFRILSPTPITMGVGTLIDYRVLLGGFFPMRWRSRISVWEPPHRFADEQLRGPYALWNHEHRFVESKGGTLVIDHIHYQIPFSWIPGTSLVHRFLVQPDLKRIFAYRRTALLRHFGLPDPESPSSPRNPS